MRALLVLLAQATVSVAFVAPPRWGAVSLPREGNGRDSLPSKLDQPSIFGSTSGSIVLGVFVASALARIRKSAVSRKVWLYETFPNLRKLPGLGKDQYGMRFQVHKKLRRSIKENRAMREGKNARNFKTFRENNIWSYMDNKFEYWRKDKEPWQLYKGPENINNPYFPGMSAREAVTGWAAPSLSSSIHTKGHASTFAMGAPSFAARRNGRPAAATVMKAHKKAAGSSRCQGHTSSYKEHGIRYLNAKNVKKNWVLTKSLGYHWHPGANVHKGRTFNLHATKEGIIQWTGAWNHREAIVVPKDYVEDRCVLLDRTLYPKHYLPWMGNAYRKLFYTKFGYRGRKRRGGFCYLKVPSPCFQDPRWVKLYEEFTESPAGIAFKVKKDDQKKEKLRYAKHVHHMRRGHLVKKGKLKPRVPREVQAAGGDSESEAEA
mmetsp:Transcript_9309/g.16461  ORF Transcript_9309/g.16461 Transcript_9309/m.16461 type:complete len:432 (-) Transcript_9309:112-1407(-)|eukprot:CAMPEP_0197649244 /NCGR_PEP_ID=MMETSP1338-20131121/28238_1 /TAXON_ID=43686 ORGANISM="Pelagodinium beii, Strain RCC1491" /NCGR_SAMPLE_ID=MMETSP1338 /ASSEMBLY_ACC=CAM_ASM_000754 /LENGTH=431 /DNA_ID=CAMNT_0043223385 /DNA_START=45 /DNA_END=1340 /DNA_ORIENTATION=+